MERTIICRGWSQERQCWCYGGLVDFDYGTFIFDGKEFLSVDKASIGLRSDVKDVNGNYIYEGDLIAYADGGRIHKVFWSENALRIRDNEILDNDEYEIIGNRFV